MWGGVTMHAHTFDCQAVFILILFLKDDKNTNVALSRTKTVEIGLWDVLVKLSAGYKTFSSYLLLLNFTQIAYFVSIFKDVYYCLLFCLYYKHKTLL